MQYMMMVYKDEERWDALSQAERDRVKAETNVYYQGLVQSGHAVSVAGLLGASTARTLREKNGKLAITDGPFAEAKEVLAGFQIVECKNLDEAIAIGARFPGLRVGLSFELRPVDTEGVEACVTP